jgi:hypothetical protein
MPSPYLASEYPQLTRGAQRERLEVRLLAPVWDLPLLVFLGVKVGRDVYPLQG